MRKLIVITASWCQPCRSLKAALPMLQKEHPALEYEIIDVEAHPEYARKYDIQGVPFLIFRDENGMDVETYAGTMNTALLLNKLGID